MCGFCKRLREQVERRRALADAPAVEPVEPAKKVRVVRLNKKLTVGMSAGTFRRLTAAAEKDDVTLAAIVRKAIKAHLRGSHVRD